MGPRLLDVDDPLLLRDAGRDLLAAEAFSAVVGAAVAAHVPGGR